MCRIVFVLQKLSPLIRFCCVSVRYCLPIRYNSWHKIVDSFVFIVSLCLFGRFVLLDRLILFDRFGVTVSTITLFIMLETPCFRFIHLERRCVRSFVLFLTWFVVQLIVFVFYNRLIRREYDYVVYKFGTHCPRFIHLETHLLTCYNLHFVLAKCHFSNLK